MEALASELIQCLKSEPTESSLEPVLSLILVKVFPGAGRKRSLRFNNAGLNEKLAYDTILDRTMDVLFLKLLDNKSKEKQFTRNIMEAVNDCDILEAETRLAFQARYEIYLYHKKSLPFNGLFNP